MDKYMTRILLLQDKLNMLENKITELEIDNYNLRQRLSIMEEERVKEIINGK